MDPRLQKMLDHHEISQVVAEYCHGCDRVDEHHMASVYHPDSWDDHGHLKATGPDFAHAMSRQILRDTKVLTHQLGQTLVTVDGDIAGAETYFFAVSRDTREDGAEMCNQLGGRFVDEMERRDGSWKIKRRTVVRDWGISLKIDHDWTEHAGLIDGSRSNEDPSCAALRRPHSGHPMDEAA